MYKYIVCARLWIAELREAEGNLIVSEREKAMEAGRALSLSLSINIAGRGETQSGLSSTL